MSSRLLRSVRLFHMYLGVLIAPALLFFAFTGALQTFSLHETTRGSSYQPPQWAVVLGQIHKKQTSIVPVRRPAASERTPVRAEEAEGVPSSPGQRAPAQRPSEDRFPAAPSPTISTRHPLPLKIFFLLVAIGLFTSTLTGIYMAYRLKRNARLVTSLLVLGTVVPVVLVFV